MRIVVVVALHGRDHARVGAELLENADADVDVGPGYFVAHRFADVMQEAGDMQILKEFHSLQCESANRILERGTIDGSVIMPAIKKSLQSVLIVKPSSPGISTQPVIKTNEVNKVKLKLSADEIKKMNRKAFHSSPPGALFPLQ